MCSSDLKVDFAYGLNPKDLARAEIVLGVAFDPLTLRKDAPKLKWIQSLNAGVEKLAPKMDRSFTLTNASGLHGPKGGEFALASMMILNNAVQIFVGSQRKREWKPVFTTPIEGKTVVIAGTGGLGQATARQAKKHKMTIIGVNTTGKKVPGFDRVVKAKDMAKEIGRAHV